jgi:cytochrome c-type biogenesis protein CcmH/NrfG
MLGDVLCKDNRFIDALSAYQKAEELLKNNMK